MYVFGELSQYAGMTFEEFVRKFLTDRMRRAGEIPADRELKPAVIEGEEIDAFLEDPLIVVEITAHAKSPEKIEKLLRKAEKIREAYGREPRKILIVQTADKDVAKELRRIAEREDVELIIGRIL
jgi:nucleotide-binding universal stress UspA family protein